MKFRKYIIRRILQMIPVLLIVTIINFLLITLAPGDPATVLAGENATIEQIETIREAYGLNEPIAVRLGLYLEKLLQGDLGFSYSYQRPVSEIISERIRTTLILVLTSQSLAIVFGTLLGAAAARRERSLLAHIITDGTLIIYCMPPFWLGIMMILLFSSVLPLFPSSGMYSFRQDIPQWLDMLHHLVLPAFTLFLCNLPIYTKLTRSTIIEVAQEDFITTARAIGYSEKIVYRKHALRNALLPTVTIAGMSLSSVFAGALMVETVFAWPGMGRLVFDAVSARDYPVIMGGFLMTSILVIIGSFITDMIYLYLDPRMVQS